VDWFNLQYMKVFRTRIIPTISLAAHALSERIFSQ
jgi:hypothetical protein